MQLALKKKIENRTVVLKYSDYGWYACTKTHTTHSYNVYL